ncbi:DUF4384 domain-containing protein [Oceanithermus sp.]
MKRTLLLLGLALGLSACTITLEPGDVSFGISVDFELSNVITRFEPDRGEGAVYYPSEEVRFVITLRQPGYVSLVAIDPDGRTYEFEHGVYLPAGTHVLPLPQMRHRYVVEPPTGKQRVRAVYTDTRPGEVYFRGVYTTNGFNDRLRLYFRQSYAQVRDVNETYFYIAAY